MGLENASGDPRWDYLSGFLGGLLQYDLGRAGVTLVERRDMDEVLREQELSLSGLLENPQGAKISAGKILGARIYLDVANQAGKPYEANLDLGSLSFSVELVQMGERFSLELAADRLDVRQGMHRE